MKETRFDSISRQSRLIKKNEQREDKEFFKDLESVSGRNINKNEAESSP